MEPLPQTGHGRALLAREEICMLKVAVQFQPSVSAAEVRQLRRPLVCASRDRPGCFLRAPLCASFHSLLSSRRPRRLISQIPTLASSSAARSLARLRRVGVRVVPAGRSPSRGGVSRSAKRWSASREVTQRPPSRTASNRTTSPLGDLAPFRTQRRRQDRVGIAPPRPGGRRRAA